MDRKDFLKNAGLALFTGTSLLTSCASSTPVVTSKDNECGLTDKDAMGPFFVKGSSQVVNLNTQNLPGTPLFISGYVYQGTSTNTPIPNAKIDIWHADDAGAYHPNGSGNVKDYPISSITLRGFVLTDAKGFYSFNTIVPGYYGSRALHIHYRISYKNHRPFVTQNYFKGDPRIPHDGLASLASSCRIISLSTDVHYKKTGQLNFHL